MSASSGHDLIELPSHCDRAEVHPVAQLHNALQYLNILEETDDILILCDIICRSAEVF